MAANTLLTTSGPGKLHFFTATWYTVQERNKISLEHSVQPQYNSQNLQNIILKKSFR